MKTDPLQVYDFLEESNAIEGVHDEVSYIQAKRAWDYLIKQNEMSVHVVLKAHKILMLHQRLMPNEKGYFRTQQVWVGGREGMDWKEIAKAVEDWCGVMNVQCTPDIFVLPRAALSKGLHVRYEKIHPFIDGNGRTGRMFMNWWRLRNGLPLLVIHTGWEQMEYYKWFK
jgi:Fic family protein